MADITTAFVQQYGRNVEILSQQKGSKTRSIVRMESVTGKNAFFDQLGSTTAIKRTTRNDDTPLIKSDHQRRMVTMYDYVWADLLDQEDKLKMLIDPTSEYAMNAAFALGRAMDAAILAAAGGTAYTGETGATPVTFPVGQQVVVGATGLTLPKLLAAKEILDNNDVDPDEERFIIVTGTQLSDLLNTTEVKSADYNTVKALVQGQLDTFCGFKFILCSQSIVPVDISNDRLVYAFAKNGLLLALAKDITSKIEQRADKNYATQVFSSMGIGATRMEEKKVVEIACKE